MQLARLVVSSLNQRQTTFPQKFQSGPSVNRYFRRNRHGLQRDADDSTTITSTITSYSLYISSSTKTVSTTFAAAAALSCLPSGFTLCPAAG